MQEYVQKSTTTTLPLRLARVSGPEFSHVAAPLSSGMSPSIGPASPPFADIMELPDIIASPGFAGASCAAPDIAGAGLSCDAFPPAAAAAQTASAAARSTS